MSNKLSVKQIKYYTANHEWAEILYEIDLHIPKDWKKYHMA